MSTVLPLGLQLYAVRESIESDFEGMIRRVAEMGYLGVETAFFPESVTYAQAGQLFKDLGLTVLGVHCEIPSDDEQKDAILATAAIGLELSTRNIIIIQIVLAIAVLIRMIPRIARHARTA